MNLIKVYSTQNRKLIRELIIFDKSQLYVNYSNFPKSPSSFKKLIPFFHNLAPNLLTATQSVKFTKKSLYIRTLEIELHRTFRYQV